MKAPRALLFVALTLAVMTASSPAIAQMPAPRITLDDALKMIAAAQTEAASKNFRMSFAVVNSRGDLIAVARMPGAGPATADTAIGKAMMSAIFGRPSAALVQTANSPVQQGLNDLSGGRLRFLQGALPLVRGGFTVGAIAGSGGTSQQDEDTARAALPAAGF